MARAFQQKMVGIQISVTAKSKAVLDAQAQARKYSTSAWAGMLFDLGFAAVCARDKGTFHTDADLDAITGATLLLKGRGWDVADIAAGTGQSEATIETILDTWKHYRRASQ